MSFERAWVVFLVLIPVIWCAWEWGKTYRKLGLALKAATLTAILLAIAEPTLRISETYSAVAVLSDVSSGVPDEQKAQQATFLNRARDAAGAHVLRPMEFGSVAARRLEDPGARRSTNIETAIRDSIGALPPDRIPRVVLLSDGLANAGAVERAVYQAKRSGVPVDTVALAGRIPPELSLEAVAIPTHGFVGDRLPINLTVRSPREAAATVELFAEGKSLGTSRVTLPAGLGNVTVRAAIEAVGSTLIEGSLTSNELGELRFAGTVSLTEPRVLLISSDDPERNQPLIDVLDAAGFAVTRASGGRALSASSRNDFDLVITANENIEQWSDPTKEAAEAFVLTGGGFLLIAGERNLYQEPEEGAEEDALTAMLPAKLAPPQTPEGTAVVLVVDKSSSMEGKKMQLARQSAIGVVENVRPIDSIGVLAFDNSFEWAAPLRRNEFPAATKKLISGIIADGGTQIAPALHEAYRIIQPTNAVYKHILLLTDGISEEGDSIALAREAAMNEVTISTIGMGQDVNRSYLERVAKNAEGKSYFLIDVSALEQIVLKDVMEHTGSSVTEEEFVPIADEDYEVLADVDLNEPGPLLGWVKFESKPESDVILRVDDEDPLLVRWQYGRGRATVFASDATDRWAANWVGWAGFDRFWANIARDLLPRSAGTETQTEYDAASDEVIVHYRSDVGVDDPPELFVIGPDDYREIVVPERFGDAFVARFPTDGHYGLFRIRPRVDNAAFPEVGYFRENSELSTYGSDEELMRTIAAATGGRFNPAPEQVFDTQGESIERPMALWPMLLALAIALNLVELFARKGWLPILGRWA